MSRLLGLLLGCLLRNRLICKSHVSSGVLAISWSAFRCANIPSVNILICTCSLLMKFFQNQMFCAAILIYCIHLYSYCIWGQTRHIQSGFRVRMTCFLCWFLHLSRMQYIWTCKITCDIQPGQSVISFAGIYPFQALRCINMKRH